MTPASQGALEHSEDASAASVLMQNTVLRRTVSQLRAAIDAHAIAAITDRRGIILDANAKFAEISKYRRDELIGAPQNIVNSGHHPRKFWKEMWATIGRGGTWRGEVCNRAKDGSEYWVATTIVPLLDDQGRPERYISLRTDTTHLHQEGDRVRARAFRDELTGLPNRTALIERLDDLSSRAPKEYRALITVSLDDLEIETNHLGYSESDRLLAGSVTRLEAMQHRPAAIARTDSGVFALVFERLGTNRAVADARAMGLAEEVSREIAAAIRLDHGVSVLPPVRVGFALSGGWEKHSGSAVYQQADLARRRGARFPDGGRPNAFDPSMVEELKERAELLIEMRGAAARGELRLYLQPIVDAEGTVESYEGLVRWQHPRRGLVPPGAFIPLAEQSGLIVEIGAWVLDAACAILGDWAKDAARAHLMLSVNVSERQLNPQVFPELVADTLARHRAPAQRLKIEITETLMHNDIGRSTGVLQQLREHGVQVALDDFGTGHSSLSHLVRLPVDQLKLDQSFVAPITEHRNGAELVRAIVELAHVMELSVVVEGVETEAQYLALKDLGVDSFQGYLFGRPAPLAEIFLADQPT